MPSIAELLVQAAEELRSASETPRLDAEVLLAHASGWGRSHFWAWPDKLLGTALVDEFRCLLERRLAGEPVAYLVGRREFWSREFRVTPAVLIPRPETELLVELALSRVGCARPRILDLGTGSGVLAITLALEIPGAMVTAIDASEAALAVARGNAEALGAARVDFRLGDWFSPLDAGCRFELIVSNPPYVATGDIHLEQGDVRFEPPTALSSGPDGLQAIRLIVSAAPEYLAAGGCLLLEHGFDQGQPVADLLTAAGFRDVETHTDLQGNPRASRGRWG